MEHNTMAYYVYGLLISLILTCILVGIIVVLADGFGRNSGKQSGILPLNKEDKRT